MKQEEGVSLGMELPRVLAALVICFLGDHMGPLGCWSDFPSQHAYTCPAPRTCPAASEFHRALGA